MNIAGAILGDLTDGLKLPEAITASGERPQERAHVRFWFDGAWYLLDLQQIAAPQLDGSEDETNNPHWWALEQAKERAEDEAAYRDGP